MENENIILKLNELNKLSKELDIPEPERLGMLKSVTDYANQFIEGLATVKAFDAKQPTSLEITNQKRSVPELLNLYQTEVAETGINAASGKLFFHFPKMLLVVYLPVVLFLH